MQKFSALAAVAAPGVAQNGQNPNEQIGNVHIDIQGRVHSIVERLRILLRAIDVIPDIQAEESGSNPVGHLLPDTENQQDHFA